MFYLSGLFVGRQGVFVSSFASLGLSAEIVSALTEQGYETPTPIQEAAIPQALAGHDILAAAQTGTGKTAAFMLPSLQRLKAFATTSTSPAMHPVRMLVLTPTRELADQIDQNVKSYIKNINLRHAVIFGGTNMNDQTQQLRRGVEIVVATVGRLLDHVEQKNIQLNKVDILVLDEADRMLDMGFIDDIRRIVKLLPAQRQILLFSATFAPEIKKLANDFMRNPVTIEVAQQNATGKNIEQHMIAVDGYRKKALLERLIVDLNMNQVIVFCKTKMSVDQVTRDLQRKKLSAQAIHGDKSQGQRTETLAAFKKGDVRILVATDVAARGLDISDLPFVVNYEMPTNAEDYVHRIGRTGRAGAEGVALSMMDEHDKESYQNICKLIGQELPIEKIESFEPSWMSADKTSKSTGKTDIQVKKPTTRAQIKTHKKAVVKDTRDIGGAQPAHANSPDAGNFCGKITGRERRRRGQREVCALVMPNYGKDMAVTAIKK